MNDLDDLVPWLRVQLDAEAERAWSAAETAEGSERETLPDGGGVTATGPAALASVHGSQDYLEPELATHITAHDPARILREIDAKRQLVAMYADAAEEREILRTRMREAIYKDHDELAKLHRRESGLIELARALVPVVRTLALPYADRPGYKEGWRP